jgi:Fe2+ transport system protein FeoA
MAPRGRSLNTFVAGEWGEVAALRNGTRGTKRLADMGLIPGAHLEIVRPGQACIVRLDGVCIALGFGFQQIIELTPFSRTGSQAAPSGRDFREIGLGPTLTAACP